jgi:hypothetical protein
MDEISHESVVPKSFFAFSNELQNDGSTISKTIVRFSHLLEIVGGPPGVDFINQFRLYLLYGEKQIW